MLKKILYISLMCFCFSNISTLFAQSNRVYFPHTPNFTTGTQPTAWTKTTDAVWTTAGLQLTPSETYKFGAAALDLASFDVTHNITIRFDYAMQGPTEFSNKGDGFSFFLYDGDKVLSIGGTGRALGYTRGDGTTNTDYGLDGAYLGIGFDVYGNFKENVGSSLAGLPRSIFERDYYGSWFQTGTRNRYKSHITLRAGTQKNGNTNNYLRTQHYPVLYTTSTIQEITSGSYLGGNNPTLPSTYSILNQTNGTISSNSVSNQGGAGTSQLPSFNYFELYTENNNFNTVEITLKKSTNTAVGILISVKVIKGGVTYEILKDFEYRKSVSYKNTNQSSGTNSTLNATPPDRFKLGFAASTGAAYQRHLIKNVTITLPNMHTAIEDNASLCMGKMNVEIEPFKNDTFNRYTSATNTAITSNTTGDPSFVNFGTFIFTEEDGSILSQFPTTGNSSTISYSVPNVGTWVYSKNTGKVTFTPVFGFLGTAEIYYTVKGNSLGESAFGHENYRTRPTKISVQVNQCGAVLNSQIPSRAIIRSGK